MSIFSGNDLQNTGPQLFGPDEINVTDIPTGLRQDDTPDKIRVGRNIESLSFVCVGAEAPEARNKIGDCNNTGEAKSVEEPKLAHINDETGDVYLETQKGEERRYYHLGIRTEPTNPQKREFYKRLDKDESVTENEPGALPVVQKYIEEGVAALTDREVGIILRQGRVSHQAVLDYASGDVREDIVLYVAQNPQAYSAQTLAYLARYRSIVDEVIPAEELFLQEGTSPERSPTDQAILLSRFYDFSSRDADGKWVIPYLLANQTVLALRTVVESRHTDNEQREHAILLLTLGYVAKNTEPFHDRREAIELVSFRGNPAQKRLAYQAMLRDFPYDVDFQSRVISESPDPAQREQAADNLLSIGTAGAYSSVMLSNVSDEKKKAALATAVDHLNHKTFLSESDEDTDLVWHVVRSPLATPDQKASVAFRYLEDLGYDSDRLFTLGSAMIGIPDEKAIEALSLLRDRIPLRHWIARGNISDRIEELETQTLHNPVLVLKVGD